MANGLPAVYPRLWRFCLTLTRDRANADDLAQTTCARALENSDKFQPDSDLDRWIFTMARRLWLNDIRAQKVRRGQGAVDAADAELADTKPHVDVNIFASEVLNEVHRLPDGARLAVLLVYVEGYSYKEAAAFLEVPIGTIMSRLASARRALAGLRNDEGDVT